MYKIDDICMGKENISKMKLISNLPEEIVYQIFAYVDYETKIMYYLDKYSYLRNKRELSTQFTLYQLNQLYLHCVVDKLSVKKIDSNRRCLRKDIMDLFPECPSYTYIDAHGDEMTYTIMHPVLNILKEFKNATTMSSYSKLDVFMNVIKSFQNISCDIQNVNYKIREILCKFLQSIIFYKRELKEREKRKENILFLKKRRMYYEEMKQKLINSFKKKNGRIHYPFKMRIQRSRTNEKKESNCIKLNKENVS
jgi:dGTP triphosphohydrolase